MILRYRSRSISSDFLASLLVCVQPTLAQIVTRLGRSLEQGRVDEDDEFDDYLDDTAFIDDNSAWWQLERYIRRNTLAYDTIEAFFYIADAFFILWLAWGCLVHVGICPDDRVDRRRDLRRINDGRGVFAPVRNLDPFESSDDESEQSMEYGNSHLDSQYGDDVNEIQEAQKINQAAQNYFSRPDRQRKKQQKANKNKTKDEEQVLDLELTVRNRPDAQTLFI